MKFVFETLLTCGLSVFFVVVIVYLSDALGRRRRKR